MLYSALITRIAKDSHAYPEAPYTTDIKQKFLDAVVELSPTASIDNIKELVKGASYTIGDSQIELADNFVKTVSIRSADNADKYTFIQVTADMWDRLGSDAELDPNKNHCFYFVEGRIVKFYISTTGNMNNKVVTITYLVYPTQWATTQEMYDIYSSLFIEACKVEAVKNMITLQRGEQNDVE